MMVDREARDQSAIQARDGRITELETLLKQAIARGAKLGRARADVENAKADVERKLSKFKASTKSRVRRERRRLQGVIEMVTQRAERAEDRLVEYLDASV